MIKVRTFKTFEQQKQTSKENKSNKMPGSNYNMRNSFGVRTRSGARAFDSRAMLDTYSNMYSTPKSSPSKGTGIKSRLRRRY